MALSLRPEQCESGFFPGEKFLLRKASYEYIEKAVELMGREGEGVVTAPYKQRSNQPVFLLLYTEIFKS